jgi:HK97 gp10 family phage protein
MSIQVQGLDEAIKALAKYGEEVKVDTAKAMNTSMIAVESNAKLNLTQNRTVDTGRLRASIVTTKAKKEDLVASTVVGANYGPYIEFGTGAYARDYLASQDAEMQRYAMQFYVNGRGKLPARPFLFPAWEQERPKLEKAIAKLLKR